MAVHTCRDRALSRDGRWSLGQPETSSDLVVLKKNCGAPAEAATLRSLLDAHGIACVIQGEQHRSMLGMMGGYIEVNVLVAARDLELARALLQEAEGRASLDGSTDTEAVVCPVHGQRSTATCGRCGTFLCEDCDARRDAQGTSVCEDCAEHEAAGGEARRTTHRRLAAWLVLLYHFGPLLVVLVAMLLERLLG